MSLSSMSSHSQDHTRSWTDDLPVCHLSGVGFSTNQVYREDGNRREQHEFEDTSFHFKVDGTYLYGVFDGHDGSKMSKFAAQRMPAELLLDQLRDKDSDQQVKQVLTEAFESVDKHYFESIDDALAEKAKLEINIPEGMSETEARQKFPELMRQLSCRVNEIKGGTMAVVVLILNNRLFVANVGCSRALLCCTDDDGTLHLSQLTVDHNLHNETELKRLLDLGLDTELLRKEGKLGNIGHTRTIGDHHVKQAYRDIEALRQASSAPVLATPEIYGGVDIDPSCAFLILMSDGLYKSLEDATGTERANAELATMVATEFSQQSTLNGVAQAVVDKVVRKHHDLFMLNPHYATCQKRDDIIIPQFPPITFHVVRKHHDAFMLNPHNATCQKRDDITLLVRNFNYPLASPLPQTPPQAAPPPQKTITRSPLPPLSLVIPSAARPSFSPPQLQTTVLPPSKLSGNNIVTASLPFMWSSHIPAHTGTVMSTLNASTLNASTLSSSNTNDSTQSSDELARSSGRYVLPLDESGRVAGYVDFALIYESLRKLSEEEARELEAELEPRLNFETIVEEQEPSESDPGTPLT